VDYPHRIRLRGPWECEPIIRIPETGVPAPPHRRMTLPCRWNQGGLADFAGRVRFRRRFGFPGRIDTFERVWITCAGVTATADVSLNGRQLGHCANAFDFEVTSLLQVRNELIVDVEGPADSGGLWGEVALEVRCTAYLKDIVTKYQKEDQNARLQVSGQVVGTAERPLDLYVLCDGSTVAYTTIDADAGGRSFQLLSDELAAEQLQARPRHLVRVDLVNGASLWYQFEQIIDTPGPGVPGGGNAGE
jgi:hypothetical protein